MNPPYTVSDLVAEFLDRIDVSTVFGIVSVHNIPMLDAMSRRNRVRFVMTRGELGAGHMADGYARAGRRLGVLVTSTGPGAAGAISGLQEARFAGTPLLHLTGHAPTALADRDMGLVHDAPHQHEMLASVSKAAFRIRSPQQALGVLTKAVVTALTAPCGPVSVEVPIDIQRSEIPRPATLDHFVLPLPLPRRPDAAEIDALEAMVRQARRPMLWLGRGAAGAGREAERLLDLGFGMVTSWAGRAVVDDRHPRNIGALNGNGLGPMERFYETVDLMIVAGSRLRGHETGDFSAPLPASRVQIDIDPIADGRTYPNDLFVCADAAATLGALADRLAPDYAVDTRFPAEVEALKTTTQTAFRNSLGPYAPLPAALREVMPEDAVWARDVTIMNSTWGNRLFPLGDPALNVYPIGAGIGQGMPLGIGAALSDPSRKTVILTGDGGFFLNMGELWTAIQEELDVTVVVMNDRGYGVIRQIQDKHAGGRRRFDTLLGPDLEGLAALAGIPFRRVRDVASFGDDMAAAIAVPGPSMVEVDMIAIGDVPPYYPYGPKADVA